jgi:hypothetical protein
VLKNEVALMPSEVSAPLSGGGGRKAQIIGRLILTTLDQPLGAPIVDRARSTDAKGNFYHCRAILLPPWRKNKYGERFGPAFVIGWRVRSAPRAEAEETVS